MVTKKVTPAQNTISNCSVVNQAASISPETAIALAQLAIASAEHAKAIIAIANAMKGAEAHMQSGFRFGPP